MDVPVSRLQGRRSTPTERVLWFEGGDAGEILTVSTTQWTQTMAHRASNCRAMVAVIDHDSATRGSFEALLGGAGFDVQIFCSGNEFLQHLPDLCADCILLEFRMPDNSGQAILEALSHLTGGPPVIVMSTMPKLLSPSLAREFGALTVLDKPIEEACLFAAIDKAVAPVIRG